MSQKEFDLIQHYFFWPEQTLRSGVKITGGDDASVISLMPNQQLVQSIDTQVQDVHFPKDFPPYYIGQRALRCAISDLAAMGATPQGFHLALSLPKNLANDVWLKDFSLGLKECAEHYQISLLGGDTTSSQQLVITIQVQGYVEQDGALLRSGAKAGDDLWLSGNTGLSALALAEVLNTPDKSDYDFSRQAELAAYYLPAAEIELAQQLAGIATSALDISDGLLQDAQHIAQASHLDLIIDTEQLPIAQPLRAIDQTLALKHILTGGDDYQLLFTADKQQREAIAQLKNSAQQSPSLIGQAFACQTTPQVLLNNSSPELQAIISNKGFQHF